MFTEMIQLGSILAIMWLYRAKLDATSIAGLADRRRARRSSPFALIAGRGVLPALSPARSRRTTSSGAAQERAVIAVAFIVGGVVMLVVERLGGAADRDAGWTTRRVGQAAGHRRSAQVLALIPGVSRSGATIVGGMLIGLDRPAAAEFSFFLAMPTMAAAFAHSAAGAAPPD